MPEETFKQHLDALAKCRLEKPKKLRTLSSKWWEVIATNEYNFNKDREEVRIPRLNFWLQKAANSVQPTGIK